LWSFFGNAWHAEDEVLWVFVGSTWRMKICGFLSRGMQNLKFLKVLVGGHVEDELLVEFHSRA